MSATHAMGIDIGGGGVRCLVVDTAGLCFASASRPWSFPAVEHPSGLACDVDLDETWRLIGEASREAIGKAEITGEQVGSVAVSAIRFGTVIIDGGGAPIFAVPNRDARAVQEAAEIAAECGDAVNRETGSWPAALHLPARLRMLRKADADRLAMADCVFSIGDWVNYKLCGIKATDLSQAGVTQLFDLEKRVWNTARIEALGVSADIFPPVKSAGSKLGTVGADAAAHLGVTTSTVVGLGGGDTQCSLLGAGAVRPGDIACVAGTTTPVVAVTDTPVVDAAARTWSGHHVIPGLWVLESSGGAMGETLTFMGRLLFPDAPEPELRLLAEAAQSDYGSKGMLSSFGAEVVNFQAPAMPAGQITLSHLTCAGDANPRAHLCRAIVEGYGAAVRANIDRLSEVTGASYERVLLTAGFSRSNVFARILADITAAIIVPAGQSMTSGLGAAICAAVAEGKFADMAAAVDALVRNRDPIEPDPANRTASQQVYADWLALREAGGSAVPARINDHVLPFIRNAEGNGPGQAMAAVAANALITAAFDKESLRKLRDHIDVEYASIRETRRILKGADLVSAMQGKQILVTEVDIVDAEVLAKLPELRVVVACRGNAVNVDFEACSAFGIPVLFTPGRNSVAVADLTVAFMLALARKLIPAAQFLKDETVTASNMAIMGRAFAELQGNELWRKTIGLVGLGAVGRMVAKRLQGFDARVIAADPFASPEAAALAGVELVDLATLLRESDFVSLHAAVTPATTNMIGTAEFAAMKKGAHFINTARAQLVDEVALLDALEDGTLAGAALDTFLEEPPGFDHPLVQHPNVLSAPHIAGNTHEIAEHQGADVAAALLTMLAGGKPQSCLNPEVLNDFAWDRPRRQPSSAELEALLKRPAPGVSDLERDQNAGIRHRGVKAARRDSSGGAEASPEIVDKMHRLFGAFCNAIVLDGPVRKFAQAKKVTLGFNAPDVKLKFFIALDNGAVAAEVGDRKGDVEIAMRGVLLDGLFNGTTDATAAVMKGEISLMGDAMQAMTLQDLQGDLARLYKSVRADAGDLGELASIGKTRDSLPAAPLQRDQRRELLDTVNELYEYHIITATGGNVSVRCDDDPDQCWITPSAVFKGDLSPEMMVRITLDGEKVDPLSPSPSSEWGFHTKSLKRKPKANAVIHAHAPNATILANSGIPFLPISSEAAFFGDIKRIPYTMPGSDDLAELISEALRTDWAVLMENHGIVVAGKSLRRASDMVQIIERTAEVILGCYQATGGKPPKVLPREAIDLFRSMADVVA